jgi:hypothetical protein
MSLTFSDIISGEAKAVNVGKAFVSLTPTLSRWERE